MKLKIKTNLALLFIAAVVFADMGCKKFVEDEDPSNLTPDSYYTLPEHATAAIASAYAQTRFIGGGAGIFVNNFQLLEAMTGTSKTETGQNSDLNNIIGLAFNGDNLLINNWWNGLYNVIAQTNLVLEKVPGIPNMDEAQQKKILGEAYFLRAWSYFYLVRMWGDVPLITAPQTTSSPDFLPARTKSEEVYAKIVADLQAAEASGLSWSDATGRASMGAVKALLGKVYLTMAGQPLNKGAAYYKLSADKTLEVISSNSFDLFPTYADLHDVSQENKIEHIFEIQYLVGVADNPFQGILLPNFKEISAYGTEIGSCVPTNAFYQSYPAGDNRVKDRVGFFYTTYYDGGSGALKNLTAPYIYKHFDVLGNGTAGKPGSGNSSLNWPLIRYAEVLLNYAEAQNEADGSPNVASVTAINKIRARAGLAPIGALSQNAFREETWRQRWWELCYEGITWFDMVRLRKVFNETTKGFDDFVGHTFPDNGAKLAEKHLLFPLPTSEMKNNPNLTPQNPGY